MTRALAVAFALAVACSAGPQRIGEQPSWRSSPVATPTGPTRTFAPSSEPAARYNEPPPPPPHTPLGDAIVAAVGDAAVTAHQPPPFADARLFRACAELADAMSDVTPPDTDLLDFAVHRSGIVEPVPRVIVTAGDVDQPQALVDELKPDLPNLFEEGTPLRVGVGVGRKLPDGTRLVVFAVQPVALATAPIPRSLAANAKFVVDGTVDRRYRDLEVFVTRVDGVVDRAAVNAGAAGTFKTTVGCGDKRGREQVEIVASTVTGAEVLANFPIWCGEDPPSSYTGAALPDDAGTTSPADAERQLLALANRDRTGAGLGALAWDDRLAQVARAHSEEMRKLRRVAHVSPTTGSVGDRVRAANVHSGMIAENIARASGVARAHGGLMNSPGHRANLMSSAATRMGVGVVADTSGTSPVLYVTEVFIRVPPKLELPRARELLRPRLVAGGTIVDVASLDVVAQQIADGLAGGRPSAEVLPIAERQMTGFGNSYKRVSTVTTVVSDLDAIDGKDLLGDHPPMDIGIGIAQGTHAQLGENAMWVVVLMAEKR